MGIWIRIPFYVLIGPLLAHLAGTAALSVLMLAAGQGGLVPGMWSIAFSAAPAGWTIGLFPFVLTGLAAATAGRFASELLAYAAGAVVAAATYLALALAFFAPPAQIGGIEITYFLLLAVPIGGAAGAVLCEWMSGQYRRRKLAGAG